MGNYLQRKNILTGKLKDLGLLYNVQKQNKTN